MRDEPNRSRSTLGGRVRTSLRRPANWLQLLRFGIVGISGYTVNLVTFAVGVRVLGLDYRIAATMSFLVAVSNNFVWHRVWTFDARAQAWRTQGTRFLVVSLVAFLTSIAVLQALVEGLGMGKISAQALALTAVVPISFVCNKLWSFRP